MHKHCNTRANIYVHIICVCECENILPYQCTGISVMKRKEHLGHRSRRTNLYLNDIQKYTTKFNLLE